MADEFLIHFSWITDLLQRPIADFFAPGTREHAILAALQEGWGKSDTAELLRGLAAEFGEEAGRAVEEFLALNIRRDWPEIGKREAHEGTETEDFIRLLWIPLADQGFAFTIRREPGVVTFNVTECPLHRLAEKTGLHDWLYHLACSTDFHSAPAFSAKICFARTKTLIQGHGCCNHQYYYRAES